MRHRKIGRGIDQDLARDVRAVAIARRERDHGGEIAAGAVAADHQPRRIDPELRGIAGDPSGRRDRVIDGGREFMLGRAGDNRPRSRSVRLHARACGTPRRANPDRRSPSRRRERTPGRAQGRRPVAVLPAYRAAPGSCRAARGSPAAATDFSSGGSGLVTSAALQIERARFGRRSAFRKQAAGLLERLDRQRRHRDRGSRAWGRALVLLEAVIPGASKTRTRKSRDSGFVLRIAPP